MARISLVVLLALGIAGCPATDDAKDKDPVDTDTIADTDTQVATPSGACLDRPDALAAAPTGALPCELLPPGFAE